MVFSPCSNVPAGKPAADRRPLRKDAAAVISKKLAAVFDYQVVAAVKQKLQSECAKFFQGGVLSGSQLHRRKTATAGCVTIQAVLIAIGEIFEKQTMFFCTLSSEQFHERTST
jgi:hypothetical protein